jgi:hypothetical protein
VGLACQAVSSPTACPLPSAPTRAPTEPPPLSILSLGRPVHLIRQLPPGPRRGGRRYLLAVRAAASPDGVATSPELARRPDGQPAMRAARRPSRHAGARARGPGAMACGLATPAWRGGSARPTCAAARRALARPSHSLPGRFSPGAQRG